MRRNDAARRLISVCQAICSENMKRLNYLDTLKIVLTLLVVFHHAAEPYYPDSAWPYKPSNADEMMPWIWHFLSVNAAFFMGLFFLIAGYFVPRSYDKQGFKVFVQKKLIRLGIPVVIVTAFLTLVTGQMEVGHLWYVETLLVFCLLYALVRQIFLPNKANHDLSFAVLLVLALVMGIGGHLIRQVSPQDHWIWVLGILHIEPAHFLQYVMMFATGVLAYRFQWLEKMRNGIGAAALAIGVALAIGNYLRDGGAWNDFVYRWFGIYESLLCVFLSFGLLWLFRKFVNQTNAFQSWCAQQAYGAYIVHLFVLLAVQHATDGLLLPGIVKFFLIATIASILSFLLTYLLRLIPGVKRVL